MVREDEFEALYQKHLKALRERKKVQVSTDQIGVSIPRFFAVVDGMGERAMKNGTIALSIRDR